MQKFLFTIILSLIVLLIPVSCAFFTPLPNHFLVITIDAANTGTVTQTPLQFQYAENRTVTLQANANEGYYFDHWEGDLTGRDNPVTVTMNSEKNITAVFIIRRWTIMVYMDADNNLEANGIEDLNEMEAANLKATGVDVLVLFDRVSSYDNSNGDWTNTRLYHVKNDPAGMNSLIVSERIASTELGLTIKGFEELNMGDPANVAKFIDFGKENYPAAHYGFILWNHGSGWRNSISSITQRAPFTPLSQNLPNVTNSFPGKPGVEKNTGRMVCLDDTDNDILYTQELHTALAGKAIDVVGFDVCLEAMLEVMYEIRNDADYMIASEEVTPLDGWEYDKFLNNLIATAKTPLNFIDAAVSAFQTRYATKTGGTLSGIDLSKVDTVMTELNTFSDTLYNTVTTSTIQQEVGTIFFNSTEDFYSIPGDFNIDLWDAADQIQTNCDYADAQAIALKTAIENAVVAEWHNTTTGKDGNPRAHGIAVHLCYLYSINSYDIDEAYWKGNSDIYPLSFVEDSTWVPNLEGTGLLYRLFFETFL